MCIVFWFVFAALSKIPENCLSEPEDLPLELPAQLRDTKRTGIRFQSLSCSKFLV